jgi:probable rRNA maturation factor
MTSDHVMDIAMPDERWAEIFPGVEDDTRKVVSAVFKHLNVTKCQEISLVLADDALVRDLNNRYRGKDKPTNVLSFPADGPTGTCCCRLLGDVILARETVERESAEQRKTVRDHTRHLIVHGTLHLLGYDHADDRQADEMERLETEILEKLGISDPYGQEA